jgi:hypothetical protein
MKVRQVVTTALVLMVFLISPAVGKGPGVPSRAGHIGSDPEISLVCRTVRKAPKPFLEAVEDGIAYVLDIPLAMLSPFTCPIVAPILEKLDSGPNRQYDRCGPGR